MVWGSDLRCDSSGSAGVSGGMVCNVCGSTSKLNIHVLKLTCTSASS